MAQAGNQQQNGSRLLTTIRAVRELPIEEQTKRIPVRLTGVITYCPCLSGKTHAVYILDSHGDGAYAESRTEFSGIHVGQMVEVTGVAAAGNFLPYIDEAALTVLSEGTLPPPERLKTVTGTKCTQWVEVEGIVQSVSPWLGPGSDAFSIITLRIDEAPPSYVVTNTRFSALTNLIDSRIRVRGVVAVVNNPQFNLVGFAVFADITQLSFLEPAPLDPFQQLLRPISRIYRYEPSRMGHRIRTRGTVTFRSSTGLLVVQEGTEGLVAHLAQPATAAGQVGDDVELAGFPSINSYQPTLENALIHRLKAGTLPHPLEMTGEKARTGELNARLVRVQARVLQRVRKGTDAILLLAMDSLHFDATLPDETHTIELRVPEGSDIELEGVPLVTVTVDGRPQAFSFSVPSAKNIKVLHTPSWWTVGRVLGLAAALLLALLAGALWVALLRKRVNERTENLRATLESTAEGVLVVNAPGKITSYNRKFLEMWSLPEFVLASRNGRAVQAAVVSQLATPESFLGIPPKAQPESVPPGDLLIECKDGRVIEQHSEPQTIKDKPVGFVISFRDVTVQQRLIRDLNRAKNEAEVANRAKSDFLATMSHEIRTPLNGVIGMTTLLLDTKLNNSQREYLETIIGSGDALLTVINDILDYSKIEAGKIELEYIAFDLRELAEEALEMVSILARRKQLELESWVEDTGEVQVVGDRNRLRQILLNFLSNALKFTETGSVSVQVKKESTDSDGTLFHFAVTDSGIGISADAQQRLFKNFSQADASSSRKYGGTGLGLAISKRLSEMMGGSVGCNSELGHGSTFWFTAKLKSKDSPEPASASMQWLIGKRVLIVDEVPLSRHILQDYLSHAGVIVTAAAAIADEHAPFDLILLGLRDPEKERPDLLRLIRARPNWAEVPVVLLSSDYRWNELAEPSPSGPCVYRMAKPVRRRKLFETLAEALGMRTAVISESPVDQPLAAPLTRQRGRVLLVDDNIVNQRVGQIMLERLGVAVRLASNGREAVAAASEERYDLIVMDCQMPEMDGFEATAEIRRMQAGQERTPIVALTAGVVEAEMQRCLACGMDSVLTKPINRPMLDKVLSTWLIQEPTVP